MLTRVRHAECEKIYRQLKPLVSEYKRQSRESAIAIGSMLKHAKIEHNKLPFTLQGLSHVEELLHKVTGEISNCPKKEFEKLVGFFFAQCLIKQASGRWDIHNIRTKNWSPYVILHVADKKYGVFRIVEKIYEKGVSSKPKFHLSKILKEAVGAGNINV